MRQTIIFPFQVLFTTTNSLFYDIFGFVFQITVVAAMSPYKIEPTLSSETRMLLLTLSLSFFFFFVISFFLFCLKMNELLAKFKGLKSLHFLGKGKTFKKGHLGIKRGLIRKKEGTRYYVQ